MYQHDSLRIMSLLVSETMGRWDDGTMQHIVRQADNVTTTSNTHRPYDDVGQTSVLLKFIEADGQLPTCKVQHDARALMAGQCADPRYTP